MELSADLAAGAGLERARAEAAITAQAAELLGLGERLAANLSGHNDEEPYDVLSDREYQIFLMIASGKTVSEIADELCLSVKTVSTHRSHVLEKTNMKTNAELTHYAFFKGLVQ